MSSSANLIDLIDLNDDCLIEIFRLLPLSDRIYLQFVCKRFYLICKNYEPNNVQQCLGVINESNCDHLQHSILDEDTIFNLVLERNAVSYFNPNRSLNKFELPRSLFEQLLIKCSKLKVLSLRMIEKVDNQIINLVNKYCSNMQHLTISTTTIQVSNLVWLELCTKICTNLKCLNLEFVDGLTEHLISNILRKSVSLEHFAISANDQQLHGYFFENLSDQIRSISIRKVDFFTNRGSVALMSLIAGNGKKAKKLTFKGRLASDFINQINLIQKSFKQLEELELGDSFDDHSASFQRILGQIIAKIELKKISFNLPQLAPFTVTLNALFTKLVELNRQHILKSFILNGSEISDKSIELLSTNFKQLDEFHLTHSSYFAKENFLLTHRLFKSISELNALTSLTINGLNLNDNFLLLILKRCRQLTKLDLRNCRLITNKSLIHLDLYAQEVGQSILVYLWGTDVSLLKLNFDYLFTYPSNLKLSFEPIRENLMDFDIIEDDFEFI